MKYSFNYTKIKGAQLLQWAYTNHYSEAVLNEVL